MKLRYLCARRARHAGYAVIVLALAAGGWVLAQRGGQQAQPQSGRRPSSQQHEQLVIPGPDQILRVDLLSPQQVRVGDSYQYEIRVTNVSDNLMLHDVVVEQPKSEGFTIESVRVEGQGEIRSASARQRDEQRDRSRQDGTQQSGRRQQDGQQDRQQPNREQENGNQQNEPQDREQAENEQAENEQAENEQAENEQAENEQAENEQAENEQAENEQAENEQAENEQAENEQAEGEQAGRAQRDGARQQSQQDRQQPQQDRQRRQSDIRELREQDQRQQDRGDQQAGQQPGQAQPGSRQRAGQQQQHEQQDQRQNRWTIDKLEPGQSRSIFITASSDEEGPSQACVAVTAYRPALCLRTEFVKPEVTIVKTAPDAASLCEEIEFAYHVQNDGSGPTGRLTIRDELGEGLQTASGQSELEFTIDNLEPGETRKFVANLQAQRAGSFSSRAVAIDADGNMTRSRSVTTEINQADLAVAIDGPSVEYSGRPASYTVRVTNHGEVAAPDTRLALYLPSEVQLAGVSRPAPSDEPAERHEDRARNQQDGEPVPAVRDEEQRQQDGQAGERLEQRQQRRAARRDEPRAQDGQARTQRQTERQQRRQARQGQNRQAGRDDQQQDLFAQQPQRQEQGDPQGAPARELELGTLEPGETMAVRVTTVGRQAGDFTVQAVASYVCARGEDATRVASRDRIETEIISLPSLLVAVVDQQDPIAVGEEVVYVVVVENQGTAADQNVRIEAELPEQLEFSEASGPTRAEADGRTVTFQPIEELRPGEKATWRIRAQANQPGDIRIQVHLESEYLDQRVTSEEPTRLFQSGRPDQLQRGGQQDRQQEESPQEQDRQQDRQPRRQEP